MTENCWKFSRYARREFHARHIFQDTLLRFETRIPLRLHGPPQHKVNPTPPEL